MKNIMHKVLVPIYNEMVYITFSREAATAKFEPELKEIHSTAHGLAYEGEDHKGQVVFVMFVEKLGDCLNVATVAHECYHIADMLLEKKGVQYKAGSGNEQMAYLLDYLVGRAFDCLELEIKED